VSESYTEQLVANESRKAREAAEASAPAERRFHAFSGLFFERLTDGNVRILKTDGKAPEDGGKILADWEIDNGTWGSIVLTMSKFNERPNDWQAWMDHHQGRKGLFSLLVLSREHIE
jgi:hypothetical protein